MLAILSDGMGTRIVQERYKGNVCIKTQTVNRERCNITMEEEGGFHRWSNSFYFFLLLFFKFFFGPTVFNGKATIAENSTHVEVIPVTVLN